MALFDFLKRKKETEKAAEKTRKAPRKLAKKPAEKKPAKEKTAEQDLAKPAAVAPKKKPENFSYSAVNEPHISEKGTYLAEENQYVFRVNAKTNKPEIKKAVEGIYGVDVLSVNLIKIPPKKRRIGRNQGFKKGYKKAVVKIKAGQKIEIL